MCLEGKLIGKSEDICFDIYSLNLVAEIRKSYLLKRTVFQILLNNKSRVKCLVQRNWATVNILTGYIQNYPNA